MFREFFKRLGAKSEQLARVEPDLGILSSEINFGTPERQLSVEEIYQRSFKRPVTAQRRQGVAMDAAEVSPIPLGLGGFHNTLMSPSLVSWYGSQGFIGYQLCALVAQNWLVRVACSLPGKDAVRNGYDVTVNNGKDISPEVLDSLRQLDKDYDVNYHMRKFIEKGRVFGIRIAFFLVESPDPEYYSKPFNPDGILPHSYRGIVQIDPYWVTPELDADAAGNPGSPYFYEPTWWRIQGLLIHRTHLVIFRPWEVEDISKPAYWYGGMSLPQQIFQRVYCAERTANEAPLLAMTKRTQAVQMDLNAAVGKGNELQKRMEQWAWMRDNYGIKLLGLKENIIQTETSLSDLDNVIMTQYQLCSAIARIPSTKLIETEPKGFNATGDYTRDNYHQDLKSTQANDLSPLLSRHHLITIRSDICPRFGIKPFDTTIVWKPLDEQTAKEKAETREIDSRTAVNFSTVGAIDGTDVREKITTDPDSGYDGLTGPAPEPEMESPDDNENKEE